MQKRTITIIAFLSIFITIGGISPVFASSQLEVTIDPNSDAVNAIHDSNLVVIAPGNPLTSIGPMIALKGIRKELSKKKHKVVSVSPIIGNSPISGPTGKYMEAAGIEVSVLGVAKMYADISSNIIIDTKDHAKAKEIEALNINVHESKIKMTNKQSEDALAASIIKQYYS